MLQSPDAIHPRTTRDKRRALARRNAPPRQTASPAPPCSWFPGRGRRTATTTSTSPRFAPGLLERGIAVASFDKRGVGESAGDWRDTGPAEQAADVAAQLACLRAEGVDPARLGLFGHSQGGWVVLEVAASDPSVAFVITNSGPGVTMALQERFATEANMTAAGAPAEAVAGALATQDALDRARARGSRLRDRSGRRRR